MKIQIYMTDDRDYILGYKDFHISPPSLDSAMLEISEYIKDSLKNRTCQKVVLKKWDK